MEDDMTGWTLFGQDEASPPPLSMTMTFRAEEFIDIMVEGKVGDLIPNGYHIVDMVGEWQERVTNMDRRRTAELTLLLQRNLPAETPERTEEGP